MSILIKLIKSDRSRIVLSTALQINAQDAAVNRRSFKWPSWRGSTGVASKVATKRNEKLTERAGGCSVEVNRGVESLIFKHVYAHRV